MFEQRVSCSGYCDTGVSAALQLAVERRTGTAAILIKHSNTTYQPGTTASNYSRHCLLTIYVCVLNGLQTYQEVGFRTSAPKNIYPS